MKIKNIKILLIAILFFIISNFGPNISIGKLWSTLHVNSLIGFQKLIERINLPINIWENIVIYVLDLKVFLFLTIITLFLFILKNI